MNIEKITLGHINRCYCTSHVTIDGKLYVLLASEEIGGVCYAYSGKDFSVKETVWENAGGTMSIIEIPHSNGNFLAVQNFFPGFNAATSKIVFGKRLSDGTWFTRDVLSLPYVHRFDILERDGKLYFLGATLCSSKKDRNDWSDPGKIFVGELPTSFENGETITVEPILSGLTKNHGFWHDETTGKDRSFITCDDGIYVATPPSIKNKHWQLEHIISRPISDVAVVNLEKSPEPQLVTIEPFHGNTVCVNKVIDNEYQIVYTYQQPIDFAHAVWGGELLGEPAAIVGVRRMDCELFILRCIDSDTSKYEVTYIEKGVGTSNVDVVHQTGRDIIISANHTINEAALYILTK